MMIGREGVHSVIAEKDGNIVGSNFIRISGVVGGIGPITVDPSCQNASVGKRLMQEVIQFGLGRGLSSMRLVQAAFHNRSLSLYTKLGFDVMEPLAVLQGAPLNISVPGYEVRLATTSDIGDCDNLHFAIHGCTRTNDLQMGIDQGLARVVHHNGRITGYSTMLGFSGHSLGESNEDLKALIGAATGFQGPGFIIPIRNSELFRWCLNNGLRVVQPLNLMSMGLYKEPAGAFLPSILY
jgi:hypothetical protein